MIILGLTGGIGAGKTYIANIFASYGIPIYNSDEQAKTLMNEHPRIRSELINKFGGEIYNKKLLNKELLAKKIFTNKTLINWVSKLVHPIVAENFKSWCNIQEGNIVIKEAAILIESGAYKQCDKIVVITAPKKIRIKRVCERDNMTLEQIEHRMNNQLTDDERIKHADFIINNDGTVVVDNEINKIIKTLNQE